MYIQVRRDTGVIVGYRDDNDASASTTPDDTLDVVSVAPSMLSTLVKPGIKRLHPDGNISVFMPEPTVIVDDDNTVESKKIAVKLRDYMQLASPTLVQNAQAIKGIIEYLQRKGVV